jgi:hypothetical protein
MKTIKTINDNEEKKENKRYRVDLLYRDISFGREGFTVLSLLVTGNGSSKGRLLPGKLHVTKGRAPGMNIILDRNIFHLEKWL